MKVKAFITHKKAEKYSDCQDSFAVNGENKAIAVSDGISQTIFSGIWSEILTDAFVEKPWGHLCRDTVSEVMLIRLLVQKG